MRKFFLLILINFITFSFSFGQGTIRGKITDENGESAIGAAVVLKSNRSVGTVTDLNGSYSLKISDTTPQTLVISYIGYKTIEETIQPINGEVIIRNFVLVPTSNEVKEVEITAKASKARDYYMERIKMNSATTLDYISAETMKKTGDANVVSAVARVSGVSTNSGFITVRGIGDRYVKTTINGSRIPTLDPFTNNIKLDMFPTNLVDNIIIAKTASPDLPGDWAGAYLSVETKDYPDELSVNAESSFGYNNQATFQDVLTSAQSSTDWLGYDDGFRNYNHESFMPVNIAPTPYQEFIALGLGNYYNSLGVTNTTPWNDTYFKLGLVELGLLAKGQFNDYDAIERATDIYNNTYKDQAFDVINAEAAESGQSFPNNWNTFKKNAPLNFSQSFSLGNQTKLFGRSLGFLAGFRYGTSILYDPTSTADRTNIAEPDSNGVIIPLSSINQQISRQTDGWSALLNLAYKFNPNHSLSLLFMPNLTGLNSVRDAVDSSRTSPPYYYALSKSQFYEERKQMIYQLQSTHYLPGSKIKIELNTSYTKGKSSAPDFKNLKYYADADLNYQFDPTLSDVRRNYRYLSEDLFDVRLSAELPIKSKAGLTRKIKFGGAYQSNTKEFDQYDYMLVFNTGSSNDIENNDIEQFFDLEKFEITTSDFTGHRAIELYYEEPDYPVNHTIGFSNIIAGFVMLDYNIIPSLRFSGGLRIEQANIFTDVYMYDSLGLPPNDERRKSPGQPFLSNPGTLDELSYLPSANIIYKLRHNELSPINLRLSYSQTVARPSIREYSETIMRDFELNADVFGNAELKMVQINNYDLRLESYFKSGDNISLSLFYKDLKNHIELISSNIGFSWTNVDKSQVKGIELEGRKALTKKLELKANVTFVYSRTTVIEKVLRITNGIKTYIPTDTVTRAMFGQAPYVLNGMLTYVINKGLLLSFNYNVQGPRLVLTSTDGAPDIYELPRHLLDFKISKSLWKHFTTSFTVRDILSSPIRRSYNFTEGWLLDFDNYVYGTNYILSISYKL